MRFKIFLSNTLPNINPKYSTYDFFLQNVQDVSVEGSGNLGESSGRWHIFNFPFKYKILFSKLVFFKLGIKMKISESN